MNNSFQQFKRDSNQPQDMKTCHLRSVKDEMIFMYYNITIDFDENEV